MGWIWLRKLCHTFSYLTLAVSKTLRWKTDLCNEDTRVAFDKKPACDAQGSESIGQEVESLFKPRQLLDLGNFSPSQDNRHQLWWVTIGECNQFHPVTTGKEGSASNCQMAIGK